MAGSASGLAARTARRFRRSGRPAQCCMRRRAAAAKAASCRCRNARVATPRLIVSSSRPVDSCASDGAAAAAGAVLRRAANVGPEASLHEVAEKWSHICKLAGLGAEASQPAARRVRFAEPDVQVVHEIVPYSEIYGLHPREFVFGRNFFMIPSGGDFGFVDFLTACRRGRHCSVGGRDVDEDNNDTYESEEEYW